MRLKGEKCQHETIEFGEKVHYRFNVKAKPKNDKLEATWREEYFLDKWWRAAEAVIGTMDVVLREGS